jgi:nucleotide-binding universal stress UspA family protein
MTEQQVTACIDGSVFAASVCDHAAWAAQRIGAPVTLLHAIDHWQAGTPRDFSGSIGLGSQEALLEALAEHDHQAGKLALERGRLLLDGAQARLRAAGVGAVTARQVHGPLVERLLDEEDATRVVVIGRRAKEPTQRRNIWAATSSAWCARCIARSWSCPRRFARRRGSCWLSTTARARTRPSRC